MKLSCIYFPRCALLTDDMLWRFKRGFPDLEIEIKTKSIIKKLSHFEMPAFWTILPAQTLTLSGRPAMGSVSRLLIAT